MIIARGKAIIMPPVAPASRDVVMGALYIDAGDACRRMACPQTMYIMDSRGGSGRYNRNIGTVPSLSGSGRGSVAVMDIR